VKDHVLEGLLEVIKTSSLTEITTANVSEDGVVTLEVQFSRGDRSKPQVTLTVRSEDLMLAKGSVREILDTPADLRQRYNRVKRPQDLTLDELRANNYPLYWNEDWLRSELQRLGTYAAIAREHGFPSPTTIASFAKRKYGIDVQGQYDQKRAEVLKDFATGQFTHIAAAKKHHVAVATVYRWIKEYEEHQRTERTFKPRTSRRSIQVSPSVTDGDRAEREQADEGPNVPLKDAAAGQKVTPKSRKAAGTARAKLDDAGKDTGAQRNERPKAPRGRKKSATTKGASGD
jgi:transposase-like protein